MTVKSYTFSVLTKKVFKTVCNNKTLSTNFISDSTKVKRIWRDYFQQTLNKQLLSFQLQKISKYYLTNLILRMVNPFN